MSEAIKIENAPPYSAEAVANAFIDLEKQFPTGKDDLTPMKIQKLVYFAHGWHLALAGNPLINEQIQAWKFGPVVRSLYDAFREYGNLPISNYATRLNFTGTLQAAKLLSVEQFFSAAPKIADDSATIPFLKRIWDVYGKYDAIQLSNATHLPGTPWSQVWESEGQNKLFVGIPDETIKQYFQDKIAAQNNPQPQAAGGA